MASTFATGRVAQVEARGNDVAVNFKLMDDTHHPPEAHECDPDV